MSRSKLNFSLFYLFVLPVTVACSETEPTETASLEGFVGFPNSAILDVYKTPTCGCCSGWIEHVEQAGITTKTHHPEDLNEIKESFGISPHIQSCHTAVSAHGYVFEGHIPAHYIQEFLADPPEEALGLAVPGMPLGSPGMEVGERFTPYEVLLLKTDGTTEVYVQVETSDSQYITEPES
jgi:hypothetical protein